MAERERGGIFGTRTRSDTLLVLGMLGESYASEIARVLGTSLTGIQRALESLELAGVIVGVKRGVERRFRLDPRGPYTPELQVLLDKMALHDVGLQERLAETRRRPRRTGKTI